MYFRQRKRLTINIRNLSCIVKRKLEMARDAFLNVAWRYRSKMPCPIRMFLIKEHLVD